MDRPLCTIAEIVEDLQLPGLTPATEARLLRFIGAAAGVIEKRLGAFVPRTETRYLDGPGGFDLWVPPLLAITAFAFDDGTQTLTLTGSDYLLYPRARWWPNGPYTRLETDEDSAQLGAWVKGQSNAAITGRWGLYDETRAAGATVASQDGTATSLVVSNGAAISPGQVLLIDTEQELVEATGALTDSSANLAEDLDTSEEQVDVNDASLLNVGEVIRVDFERMLILEKLGNTLLVVRGYAGTSRATHTSAADVYVARTYTVKRALNGTTAAAHTSATINRYVIPGDVNYLARQIAGLMLKKSQSGWAGRVGNAETGEVFYHQEFPQDPIKAIAANYRYVNG